MSGECAKLRITEVGGLAGNVPRPPRVDLTRSGLDEARSRSMDEACRRLLALARAAPSPQVGADIHGYHVEIEAEDGGTQSFAVPHGGRRDSIPEGTGVDAIIKQLEGLSPPFR